MVGNPEGVSPPSMPAGAVCATCNNNPCACGGKSVSEFRASPFAPCKNCASTPCTCMAKPVDWVPPPLDPMDEAPICTHCNTRIHEDDVFAFLDDKYYCEKHCCATCKALLVDAGGLIEVSGKKYCSIGCVPEEQGAEPEPGLEISPATQNPRYDLIPSDSMHAIALVLAYGAEKYEPRGWESGDRWGKCFSSCMGHLWAWWRGEKLDPESGLPHLAHAACRAMFLLAYEMRGVGEDDRPIGGNT